MPWQEYNPNPRGARVGDCAVRAIAAALDLEWGEAYAMLCAEGMAMRDMPSANAVWGACLEQHGFDRKLPDAGCASCYTVRDFAAAHPDGVYVVAVSRHVVTVKNGCFWDSWDSGSETPIYFYARRDN